MLTTVLAMAALFTAHDPDGVVATAPATTVSLEVLDGPVAPAVGATAAHQAAPHGLSTDQQIDRWLESRNPDATPYADNAGPDARDDRRMHSEFSATVGTGGYRDYGAAVSLPIGETGRLNLSYSQTENGYVGYGYGRGYGHDPFFNDSGYAFPGRYRPGQALEYERRVARPLTPLIGRPIPVIAPASTAEDEGAPAAP